MNLNIGEIGLSLIRKITDLWTGAKSDSLIDYTQVARVEPIVLIDADCLYVEELPDVQQSLLSVFAGYYLQAVAISTSVGKIEVVRHLDKLNPRRNPGDSAANTMGWLLAEESYKHALPMGNNKLAMEAAEIDIVTARSETTITKDSITQLSELSNLSVGKMLSVEITDGLHKASVPIAIRLMASSMPTTNLIHILSLGSKDNSAKERYHDWRGGRLEFIKDLVLCQDLIDQHRSNLMKDKDGVYTNILNRSRANQLSAIVSANPSVATASNLVIVSKETVEKLEMELNGKISNFKIRERMFKSTYIMIMVVIDKHWNRVTFYHRGINDVTEVSMRDLKAANKNSGPNVSDLLKAYQLGNSPSL
jgi:Mor family transcriptional regulator